LYTELQQSPILINTPGHGKRLAVERVPNSSTSHATDGVCHSAGEAVALMPHKWGSGKEHADVRPAEFTCIGILIALL